MSTHFNFMKSFDAIISALKAAEKGLDGIDDLPFGAIGKRLDDIAAHVLRALRAAEEGRANDWEA